jgi:hypothetical protein
MYLGIFHGIKKRDRNRYGKWRMANGRMANGKRPGHRYLHIRVLYHPSFAIRHLPSAIRHLPSAIRHPPSAISS